ncbi:MAG: hypothetical protein IPI01_15535 [Ignavibacteriae bacterium]|nr:hypothetical protein [Ignavibacteriota bacterium]
MQYALLERNQDNRVRALELAQRQLMLTPRSRAAQIGLFRLLRHYLIVQSSEEFLSWSKGYLGASFRFFEGEAMRRDGRLSSADSVFTSLLGVVDGVPQEAIRLARARMCYTRGDYANAESEYMMAVEGISSDVGAEVLFDDIKYIMSDAELDWYRGLHTIATQQEFFQSFWQFRNPLPASKSNPRLLEHIRRSLIAEKKYEFAGLRTWFSNPDRVHELVFPRAFSLNEAFNDMGLVYLRQGEPNDIVRHNYTPFDDDDHRERVDKILLDPTDINKIVDKKENQAFASEVMSRYLHSAKEDYESWLYDAVGDAPRMIFHFQKHNAAGNGWRLTPCPDFDPMILKLVAWDRRYEELYDRRQPATRATFENELKVETRATVDRALATDRQTWDKQVSIVQFPHAIDMFRGTDGGSLLDISYAIPITTLSHLVPDTMHALPVEIGFSMVNSRNQQCVAQLDTVVVGVGKGRTGALVDLIRYTVPPDRYAVSMHLRSLTGNILGAWKQALRVENYSKPGLSMSSVQLLRRSPQRGALEIDGVKVIQSPFATQLLNEPFYIYFQIYDLIPDGDGTTSYTAECRLIRAGDKGWDEGIPIHSKEKTGRMQNVNEFYTINLEKVKPGKYTLAVRVTDRMRVESISATRFLEMVKP